MLPPVLPPARPDGRNRSTWPSRWMVLCALGLVLLLGGQACVPPSPRAIPPALFLAFQDGPAFQANGPGVAVHDLDNDGDLDIALGGAAGSGRIYWNPGGWQFEAETWPVDRMRVARGYLSGDAGRLHLAAPGDETTPLALEIRWPDGQESRGLVQGGQHV